MAGSIYDVLKDKSAKGEAKKIKSMTHTKTHNGKHVMTHHHHAPHDSSAHDETHMMNDMGEVHAHMDKHNAPEGATDDMSAGAPQMSAAPAPPAPPMPPAAGMPQPGM
jgi:hypothetical protein